MKFKHLFLATLLLSIGLFLSYDKVEIKKEDKIKEMVTGVKNQQASLEEATERDVDESNLSVASDDDNITQTNKNVKKESTKNDSKKTTTKKETKSDNSKQKDTTPKEEVKEEPKVEETKSKEEQKPKEEPKPQCSDFYESITHGRVDRTSKSACISYGNIIQNNELD